MFPFDLPGPQFLIFYAACVVVTYVVYLRQAPAAVTSEQPQLAYAQV